MRRIPIRIHLIRSWWVAAFIFGCAILYEEGLKARHYLYRRLAEQKIALTLEREEALRTQQSLQRRINSQSDPAWIEVILMKELGLVPEGQKKVYFYCSTGEAGHIRIQAESANFDGVGSL